MIFHKPKRLTSAQWQDLEKVLLEARIDLEEYMKELGTDADPITYDSFDEVLRIVKINWAYRRIVEERSAN